MRKLTETQAHILKLVAMAGGSYCPDGDMDPAASRVLHELVKAKRLTVEPNDSAPPRYTLTAQGRADAS